MAAATDPKSVALTIVTACLVTGLGAWFAFGNETASKAELKEVETEARAALESHKAVAEHAGQRVENAKTHARLKAIEEKVSEVARRQEEMPQRVAREVVEALRK